MAVTRDQLPLNRGHNVIFLKTTFIHIRCKDDDGNVMAGRKFTLELPDGELIEGELDSDGWVKKDDILPGPCTFTLFCDDEETPLQTHFVHVLVKDEEERPLAGEDYELHLADGTVKKGQLDEEGKVRFEDVPPGPCWFALRGATQDTTAEVTSGGPEVHHIRLQFMDEDGQPLADKPFELEVGDTTYPGTTNAEGRVICDVPIGNDDGELTIWMDEDKSGDSFTWPIRISQVATRS